MSTSVPNILFVDLDGCRSYWCINWTLSLTCWLLFFLLQDLLYNHGSIIRNTRPTDCSYKYLTFWPWDWELRSELLSLNWKMITGCDSVRCSQQSRCLRMRPSPRLSNDSFSPRAVPDTTITNWQIIDLPTDQNSKTTTLANDSENCHHNCQAFMQIVIL